MPPLTSSPVPLTRSRPEACDRSGWPPWGPLVGMSSESSPSTVPTASTPVSAPTPALLSETRSKCTRSLGALPVPMAPPASPPNREAEKPTPQGISDGRRVSRSTRTVCAGGPSPSGRSPTRTPRALTPRKAGPIASMRTQSPAASASEAMRARTAS